ncbi:hypothetical protein RKE38_05745 [Phycicoccus sp. M110.8]|uniref:hypothetical protein n=1 Tax=Phycicoccus sp. M110.8 TaxID=3075433 RepID=UPI0028FD5CFA|nr:hypothetical protein [Phycicoccus sp. M110.8]MDU0313183.1 hypothetical protein [Phycicoccus sp. M110.8]
MSDRISSYRSYFITDKEDLDCGPEEHAKAIAFRILSSAAMEEYVEERCKQAARDGMERLKKGLPTSTGRALVIWGVSRNTPGVIPIHEADVGSYFSEYDSILDSYLTSVSGSHGLNSKDLARLVNPVGLRQHQVPSGLADKVQSLADRRDPVVHVSITRARSHFAPSVEVKQVEDIVGLLEQLDDALQVAVETFPLNP